MNDLILRLLGALAIIAVTLPRSVDAAAPPGHYVITAGSGTGNGTVYDTKSKLTWQQTAPSATYTLNAALAHCAGVGATLGGTGWRLPTIKELQSIVDLSQPAGPFVDPNAFPATPSNWFWSSSLVSGAPSWAWYLNFQNGVTSNIVGTLVNNVRCVR